MNLLVCNGPNLNLLGIRETSIYGETDFITFFDSLKAEYSTVNLYYFQSNHEGDLVDQLHKVGFNYDGIILNAGAYTHTSIAIYDAIKAINTPVIEVHISNIHQRETFRHHSYIAPACVGGIYGLGLYSYRLGIEYFIKKKSNN